MAKYYICQSMDWTSLTLSQMYINTLNYKKETWLQNVCIVILQLSHHIKMLYLLSAGTVLVLACKRSSALVPF